MANQVRGRSTSRPKRRASRSRTKRRVELVALTQTSRCGTPKRKGGLRSFWKVSLLALLLLVPIFIAAGTLAGTVTLDPPPDSEYWVRHAPQAGGDPQHTGHTDLDLLAGALDTQWTRDGFQPFLAGAVMDRDNAYVVDRNGTVSALNLSNGDTVWTQSVGGTVSATPALGYGWLYVATEGKTLVALSARTGTEIVRTTLAGAAKAPPVVSEGRLFQGTDGGILQVLDATTLDEVWRFDTATTSIGNDGNANATDTSLRKPIRAAPAVYDGRVYMAAWNHRVYAFSTTGNNHGQPDAWYWTRTVDDLISAAPTVDRIQKALLVADHAGHLESMWLSNGGHRWEVDAGGSFHKGVTVSPDRVMAATSDGRVLSISPSKGTVNWETVDEAGFIAAPVQTDTSLVTVTANGTVRLRDVESGDPNHVEGREMKWRLSSASHATPAVTDRGILVVDQEGVVTLIGPPSPRFSDLAAQAVAPPVNLTDEAGFSLTVSVQNNGPDTARGTQVLWASDDGANGTATLGTLASGASSNTTLHIPALSAGTRTLTLTWSSDSADPQPGNDVRSVLIPIAASDAGAPPLNEHGIPVDANGAVDLDALYGRDVTGADAEPAGFGAAFASAWSGWMAPIAILLVAAGVAGGRYWFMRRQDAPGDPPPSETLGRDTD